ncbi:MAG TPA: NAD(P)/FAD-dependent oxidoreductase [Vicinamibacterales bacterium]|nr:NAD(P)/FAD-dependent oxidoreductase [Vicinamibacterales bacterium]
MFDVIVAGAGPAGSVAGAVLARGGARVLIVDRARFPRGKLCGDTINPGALAVLRRLGLTASFEQTALPIDGMVVTGQHGVRVRCEYGSGARGLSLLRRDLDAALAAAAAQAGARIEEGVVVRGPLLGADGTVRGVVIAGRNGRDVRVPAPLVIAADGRRSRVALGAGLLRHPRRPRRWAIGAYFTGVAGLSRFGEMHVRPARYIGVAPLPSGDANVCLVVERDAAHDDSASLLLEAVTRDPELRDRFDAARMIAPPAVLGPLAVDARGAGAPGLLLAGDAAGFIDPMTGDGLRFAVRGGELAATAALAALAGTAGAPHLTLARLRRREFAAKWRFNRTLRALVSRDLTVALAGRVAHAAPWILQRTIAFAADLPAIR